MGLLDHKCAAPQNPTPMVTTAFCVYPKGHDGNHSWEDAPDKRLERLRGEFKDAA